jgi:peptide/nickel transport system permease protein
MNNAPLLREIGSNRLALFGALAGSFLVLIALLAPVLTPFAFESQNLPLRLQAPSVAHWFGTDELGRDILSRVAHGTRISMLVGFSVVLVSSFLGLLAGSLAGYYGGWFDEVLMRVVDVLLAFPGILLAIALVAFWGPGLEKLILALVTVGCGLQGWFVVKSSSERTDFVKAAHRWVPRIPTSSCVTWYQISSNLF